MFVFDPNKSVQFSEVKKQVKQWDLPAMTKINCTETMKCLFKHFVQ